MAVTIRDVARKARVAVGTVSRVLNNHPDVDPDLRERVQHALKALHYRPNARAQSFARNSSPVVSLILSNRDFIHPFHSHVLQGVEEYCQESGYFVIYTRFQYLPTVAPGEIQLPGVLQSHGIADCVILTGTNYDNFIEVLDKSNIQYVLLANNLITEARREPFDQVRFDDYTGALEATRYLIHLGHKRIWFIGETSVPWYRNRHGGYTAAMSEAGLEPMAQTLSFSDDRFLNGMNSMKMILEQKAPVTAVLAGNDDLAYGAWEGLRSFGLDVPRDISLIGFDDQLGQARGPSLTSVRVESTEVGRQLAKMAIAKIKSKGQRLPEVLLPTTLMKRETCRPLLPADSKTEGT
jgi:DNA-binding LacI/PurR family transcriptional regulator